MPAAGRDRAGRRPARLRGAPAGRADTRARAPPRR